MTPILNLSSMLGAIAPETVAFWFSRMSLVAALACSFLFAARGVRPALRHAVAVGGLLAIALLPLASALLPAWSLPILPATATRPLRFEPARSFLVDPAPRAVTHALPVVVSTPEPILPARSDTALSRVRDLLTSTVGWKNALILIWLNVMAALVVRVGMGAWSVRRFLRTAPALRPLNVVVECERARRVLGIERAVDVIISPYVTVPLVAGALRPHVMLPVSAASWSRERLNAVLMHELAHVRRHDNLWVLISRVVCAVFWFHPLVWILSRELRRDAERACDDIVLATGVRNSDYASHLVAIARVASSREVFAGAALTLATRSSLERRVVSILSTRTPRAEMSRRALASLACVSLVLLVSIAAAQPTHVRDKRPTPVERAGMLRASSDAIKALAPADATPPYVLAAVDGSGRARLVSRDVARLSRQISNEIAQQSTRKHYDQDRANESGRDLYSEAADLYGDERYTRAAEAYLQAAELGYRRPVALYNAGCSWALANQTDKALDALRKSFDEGFDRPDLFAADEDLNALRGDARFQTLLADVMKSDAAELSRRGAKREFDRLARRSNVEDGEWNSVGIDLMRSGDYDGAADAFDREFKVSDDEDALYNKACARALAGNKTDALALLEQSIKTGSVDADHMAEDADLITLHKEKRFDELVSLAADLELTPGRGEWNWHWGRKGEARAWTRALPHFEQMTEQHPEIGRAWFNLGFVQLKSGDAQKSTASFKRALDLGYQKPTTMYNLACCAAQTGDTDDAFEWLGRAEEAGFELWAASSDDDLDPIRDDPRFDKIAERWKSDWSFKHGYKYHGVDNSSDDEDRDYD